MAEIVVPPAAAHIVHPPKTLGHAAERLAAPLLERDDELGRLQALLAGAAQGRGAAAAVVGPAGIGKTSLLAAARGLAEREGLRILAARGGELERDFPYGVARQLLERAVRDEPAVLEGAGAAAAAALGAPTAGDATAESGFAVLHGLYWACAGLAERQPLLLLADDLHWADDASLRFLAFLQRRVADLPVVLLSGSRPPVEAPSAALLDGVVADDAVVALHPAPLSVDGVAALLGGAAEPPFAAACHAATAGNPFLCVTLAGALAAEGVAPTAANAARVTDLTARAAARDVVRRMARASEGSAALARAVAILGTEAPLRHAAALAGLAEADAAAAAGDLAARGLLQDAARLDFVHPLLRAAVAEQVPAAERALLHRRAAALLTADGVAPERVAVHLAHAPAAGDPEAAATLRTAARTALTQGDPASAARLLRRALEEPPPADLRAALLHEAGVAELQAGEPEAGEQHLREALALAGDDPGLRTAAGRHLSLGLRMVRRYAESVEVMDAVLADLDDADHALALTAELHQSAMMDPRTYRAVSPRFDGELDRPLSGRTAGERGYAAALATETCIRTLSAARVRELAQVAVDHGLTSDDDPPHSGLWANVTFPLIFAEGFELAARICAAVMDRARREGSPAGASRLRLVTGVLHLRTGSVREAAADARTSIDVGIAGGLHPWHLGLGVLLEALVELDELDAAEQLLLETGNDGELSEIFVVTWALHGRGVLRLAQGRLDEAIADLEEVGRRGREGWRPWNPAMFPYRSVLAEAWLRRGQPERARELAEEELEAARRWGGARAIGIALRARGLATGEAGDLHEAVATLARSGAALEHARALVDLGAAIARTGRRVEAREPLQEGMELAHRCGSVALTARARQELVAAGARPRRVMRSGVDALTPSELRVARMAADGMTNREIAQALFVTLRTVQVHLTHCYQKLDISSREELPAALGA